MRTILSMDEGSHMLLDMEDGYSGAVWAMIHEIQTGNMKTSYLGKT